MLLMPACNGWEGGTARRGEWGQGGAPHLNISTCRSVAQDSGWIWSENCCFFKVSSLGKVGQSGGFGDHIRGTCWGSTAVLDKTKSYDLEQENGYILDFVYSLDKCFQTCGTCRLVLMCAVDAPLPWAGTHQGFPGTSMLSPSHGSPAAKWETCSCLSQTADEKLNPKYFPFPESMYLFQHSSEHCGTAWGHVRPGTPPELLCPIIHTVAAPGILPSSRPSATHGSM